MKMRVFEKNKGFLAQAIAFAMASFWVTACTSSNEDGGFAGGTTEDAGITADLNVAGLTQKGPFAKGSAVAVQGIDCKTLKFTDETFEGSVKNDKGEFVVDNVTLSSTCAVFEVSGYYLNELTGKKSSEKLTLHALTNLKDRKHVNINVLTELEYERVMNLVTAQKMSFDDAKKQAEKEVLAAFSVKVKEGEFALSEDLNILESGNDNAALLAVSVMVQSNLKVAKLVERMNDVATDIAKDGSWDDDKTKTEIAEWAAIADKNGEFENVSKNIEKWGGSGEVSAFETVVEKFADSKKGASSSSSRHSGLDPESSSGAVDSYLNPNIDYGEMIDSRDGQVYKTVKIGNQVWMAENLNYEIDSSFCYNDSAEYCAKYGRLYRWATAVGKPESECGYGKICSLPSGNIQGVCPSGWHMPSKAEWDTLFNAVGGQLTAGKMLKSTSDWIQDGNGTDEFGFSVLPSGYVAKGGSYSYAKYYANLLSSTEFEEHDGAGAYVATMSSKYDYVNLDYTNKSYGFSVRCLKNGSETVPESSSGSAESSSSVASSSSAETTPTVCKTDTMDTCEYGKIVDERDGQTYKTVKIGEQWWMAENLNYEMDSSFCYKDSAIYCDKYGRLYSWSAAMKACPSDWHLPSVDEIHTLIDPIGGSWDAGDELKSTTGWDDGLNGKDSYGFNALPVGYKDQLGMYSDEGHITYFWTSSDMDGRYAYNMHSSTGGEAFIVNARKIEGNSVRCLKD